METAVLIAIISGTVEAIKRAFNLNTRFAPLLSVILGIGFVIGLSDMQLTDAILTGIIAGLSASGLFDVIDKTINKKK